MRPFTLLLGSLLLSMAAIAQKDKDVPAFGKVDKADLEMKSCDFDKDAEAVVLFDVAEVYCNFYPNAQVNPVNTEVHRHVRIKILSDKGLNRANIHIRYYSYKSLEDVRNITAQTYNLDPSGNIAVTKVEKKLIYNKSINKKFNEEVFTFPEVKAGSIIEYKYTTNSSWFNGLKTWYFQKSIPVILSRYTIDFPHEFEVRSIPFTSMQVDMQDKSSSARDVRIFAMKNVPALRDEPYISCEDDYLQHIQPQIVAVNTSLRRISLVRNWVEVIKELMEDDDFGVQLRKNIPRTADLDEKLKMVSDPSQRMNTIYNYVRKNMQWDGSSSIWAMGGVKSAWKDKKGTSGEINMILVNLLKDAGLTAHPILVSTRDNGRVETGSASIDQFNKVLAYVTIGEKFYVLDATDKYSPATLIPEDVMFSEGLVIEKVDTYEWGWKTLWDDNQRFKKMVIIRASVNANGTLSGQAYVNNSGYARLSHLQALKENRDKFAETYFASSPGMHIDSFTVDNEDVDTLPLIQKFNFSQPVSSSGGYTYFTANLFSGLEKNPFIADNRYSDVFFGKNQSYNIISNFTIPDGYVFEELPRNMRMIMPDTSISIFRLVGKEENLLTVRISLEFKKPYYTPDEYPYLKEFYKKLFAILNEQFVIKKKAS